MEAGRSLPLVVNQRANRDSDRHRLIPLFHQLARCAGEARAVGRIGDELRALVHNGRWLVGDQEVTSSDDVQPICTDRR